MDLRDSRSQRVVVVSHFICPGEHDAAEDEEYSHDDELDQPERDEDTLEPHLFGRHCV